MFPPYIPPLMNPLPPPVLLDWPIPALPLGLALACAVAVAAVAWRLLTTFESAPRKRQGARIHALDRVA